MKKEFMFKNVSFLKFLQAISFFLFCLFLVTNSTHAQLNPDAGYIPSYTAGAIVSATSTHWDSDPNNVIDGDQETYWLSDGCLPTNYITRPDLNILNPAVNERVRRN